MRKTRYINIPNRFSFNGIPYFANLLLCFMPAIISGFIAVLLKNASPDKVDSFYSCKIFSGISSFLGAVFGITKRSVASVILILLVLISFVVVISFIIFMIKSQNRIYIAGIYLKIIVLAISIVLFLFSILCMPNYYRLTFAEKAGIELNDYTVSDLEAMCKHLIIETNAQREKLPDDLVLNFDELAGDTQISFNEINEEYPFLGKAAAKPKPMFPSEVLSILNLTGFYFPYTGEANVNVDMPPYELPFTMCHELAHTRGFMRENEANFIGFLGCMKSEHPFVKYSGLYTALAHSMNTLYAEDSDKYFELRKLYGEKLNYDSAVVNQYWQPYFDTPAAELSNTVNDVYLKANDLSDGIKSYGRMVDLLMAKYLYDGALV